MSKRNNNSATAVYISNTFNTAWSKLSGAKAPIWSVAITFVFLGALIEWLTQRYLTAENGTVLYILRYAIIPILTNLCIAPFYGGSLMVAIQHVRGQSIHLLSGYRYFQYYIPTAICMVIIGFLSNLAAMIINLPPLASLFGSKLPYLELAAGIYSLVIYALFLFSIPLVLDQHYKVSTALITSVKRAVPYLPKIIILFLLAYLFVFLATIPALIALGLEKWAFLKLIGSLFFIAVLIWLLPFFLLLCAELYQRIILQPQKLSQSSPRK